MLKRFLCVGNVLDNPQDAQYQQSLAHARESFWPMALDRINLTLAANDTELRSEMEMQKRVARADRLKAVFPPALS